MTLKYSQIKEFSKKLKWEGFISEIPDAELRLQIAKYFDVVSDYAIGSVLKAMAKFGFVKETNFGIWKLAGTTNETKSEEHAIDEMLDGGEVVKHDRGSANNPSKKGIVGTERKDGKAD